MINFTKNLTKIGELTLDGISPRREKIKIKLALKDKTQDLVLISTNVFYLPNSYATLLTQAFQ